MKKPFISIIINCYNSDKFLKETIQSVLNQTYTNWELILFDNKSTDNSSKIFNSFSDNRFRYILSENHTLLGEARNLAIQHAKYDWVAFLDADDLWDRFKLEKQIEFTSSNNVGIIYCESEIFFNTKNNSFFSNNIQNYKTKVVEGNIFNELLKSNFIHLSSVIFLKQAFLNAGGVNPSYTISEDYDFLLKISKNYNVKFSTNTKSFYRVHENNYSNKNFRRGYIESIQIMIKYLPNLNSFYSIVLNSLKLIYTSVFNK